MALEQPLRQMVAPVAGARPPAAAFAGCQYFQADVLLRALKVRHLRKRSCMWGWAGGPPSGEGPLTGRQAGMHMQARRAGGQPWLTSITLIARLVAKQCTRLPTHPPTRAPTHPPTHPCPHPPTHPAIHPPTRAPTHPPTHPCPPPPTHPPTHPCPHPPTHPAIHPPTHPAIHPPTHAPVPPPTHALTACSSWTP